jgi:RNA polymerase-binding transcription factor DksA
MSDWTTKKQILEDRLKELDKNLHKIEDALEEPHTKDVEDFAIEIEDTEVMESLGNAGLKEIEMINAALQRIEDGIYGECQKCGEDILPERLDVLPYTPLCRICAGKV